MATQNRNRNVNPPPADVLDSAGAGVDRNAAAAAADWRVPALGVGTFPGDDDDDELTPTDRVLGLLRDSGGDDRARVKLYRIADGTKELAWCCDWTPAEFEAGGFEAIRHRFGPGRYQLRLYAMQETARGPQYVIRAKPEITIVADAGGAAPVASNPAEPGGLAAVLRDVLTQQQAQNAAILAALNTRPDPMAQMQTMLGLMSAMRAAMGLDAQRQQSPVSEIVAAVRELRSVSEELNPKAAEPSDPLSAALPMVLELIQQARSNPAPLAPVTMPADIAAAPAEPAPVASPAAAAPAAQSAPQPDDGADDGAQAQAEELLAKLRELATMAAAGKSAEDGADLIYEFLPDDLIPELRKPETVEALATAVPELAPHRAWLEAARAAAVAMFDEDAAAPPASQIAPAAT